MALLWLYKAYVIVSCCLNMENEDHNTTYIDMHLYTYFFLIFAQLHSTGPMA